LPLELASNFRNVRDLVHAGFASVRGKISGADDGGASASDGGLWFGALATLSGSRVFSCNMAAGRKSTDFSHRDIELSGGKRRRNPPASLIRLFKLAEVDWQKRGY